MSAMRIEKEIEELEQRYWQAIKDGDVDTAMLLTDDQCLVTGAQGVASIDRDKFAEMLKSTAWSLEEFELSDFNVNLPTADVAVVGYRVKERMLVDGIPLTLEAADASTWVRRRGRWLCALHTESIAGDPFGRDRH